MEMLEQFEEKREEQQKAAIKTHRAYREHLQRRFQIENRRPSTSQRHEQEREHRRLRLAKRAQFVEQTRVRDENKEYCTKGEITFPPCRRHNLLL